MSEGPIARARRAWEPQRGSRPASSTHLGIIGDRNRAHCGRNIPTTHKTLNPTQVTCTDCLAAMTADQAIAQGQHQ